jgi:hypothetical protein
VQIQDYHGDKNPYVHTANDNYTQINPNYLIAQVKATVAFAGQLAFPLPLENRIKLPLVIYRDY